MKRIMYGLLSLGLLVSAAAAAPPAPTHKKPPPPPPVRKKSFKGTATCAMECMKNGKTFCKPESCAVSGCRSEVEAKRKLEANLEAKVKAQNGRIVGKISFDIKVEF